MSEAKRYTLFQDVCYDDGAFVIPAGQVMVREADYNALRDERDRLKRALEEIAMGTAVWERDEMIDCATAALTPAGQRWRREVNT